MKITDSLIAAILKHGVVGELKNFRTEVMIPQEDSDKLIAVEITADSVQIKMDTKEGR